MSWGLLIAPHSAAQFARGYAVPQAPQHKTTIRQAAKYKARALIACAALAIMCTASSAKAQNPTVNLPPLKVEAAPPTPCVEVRVQGARSLSYDCLNQQLKDDAQQQNAAAPTLTAKDAAGTGAPTTVGTFSYTGTSIRMGNAFGHSAIPQRPQTPKFTNALVPAGAK